MAASITLYQSFNQYKGDGTIDLDNHTFKVVLLNSLYTPSASTHTVYADLTNQLTTANGYTTGGATLGSVTWTKSTVTMTFDAANVTWTATGGPITARYAVIYDDTPTSPAKPLVAYILLDTTPADVTATAGNNFELIWAATGIFTCAIA